MSAARNLLHTERIVVRWGDMDSVGHVNNAVYFTYMESARVGWLRQLAIDVGLGDRREGPVITQCLLQLPAGRGVSGHLGDWALGRPAREHQLRDQL